VFLKSFESEIQLIVKIFVNNSKVQGGSAWEGSKVRQKSRGKVFDPILKIENFE
jgi:hypothetical protein